MEMLINILVGLALLGSLVWLAWKIVKAAMNRSDEPAALGLKWLITLVLVGFWVFALRGLLSSGPGVVIMVPVSVFIGFILGILWTPTLVKTLVSPLTSVFDGGNIEAEPVPFYAIAEAKRKRGLYDVSIAEVRKQLAKFPHDMQGHLMMAE